MNMTERRKIGPIDLSALDSRKGPGAGRGAGSNSQGPVTAKNTSGGFFKSSGAGGADLDPKLAKDPQSRVDEELGIDRSNIVPIKFVSAIDSKPVYPPYLKLADFDTYIKQESTGVVGGDNKKDQTGG